MRSGYAAGRGPILMKTPSYRQQAGRWRLAVVGGIVVLALASGVIGALVHPISNFANAPVTGPFSYFPSE
jgi:hypothetical protein